VIRKPDFAGQVDDVASFALETASLFAQAGYLRSPPGYLISTRAV
jgi:hypothetical protein